MSKGKVLKIGIPLLLALFFGWYTFSKIPLNEITPHFKKANLFYVGIGIFMALLSHMLRAQRWKLMLEHLGYKTKYLNRFMAVMIAYISNYGIPRSGEILRGAAMKNYENIPLDKGFGTIVAERIVDLLFMGMVVLLALYLQFDYVKQLVFSNISPQKLLLLAVVGFGVFIIIWIVLNRSKHPFILKVKNFILGLLEGVFSVLKMKKKALFTIETLGIWILYLLMFYVTSFALVETSEASFGALLVAFISASFTIMATNGGIFVYPIAMSLAMDLFGIDKNAAYAFGWILWSSQTILLLVCGLLSFIFLPIYNKSR